MIRAYARWVGAFLVAYGLIAFFVVTGRSYWRLKIDGREVSGAAVLRQIVLDPLPLASERLAQLGVATCCRAGCMSRSSLG